MTTKSFDPNAAATFDGIYGLPYTFEESRMVLIPLPWEATTSYGGGTERGPSAILEASKQVDLLDPDFGSFYQQGIYLSPSSTTVERWNSEARKLAISIIERGGNVDGNRRLKQNLIRVNQLSRRLNDWVYEETLKLIRLGKRVGLIGGDHSVPFGAIKAHAERFKQINVLHIDAHADMRQAYEGFTWSHASIMRNVVEIIPGVARLVQVGIRDYCEEEAEFVKEYSDKIRLFRDTDIAGWLANGKTWEYIVSSIIAMLSQSKPVYVSFDIDGLDSALCPQTGTPVPGGLSWREICYLLKRLAEERQVIGFDLCEVARGSEGSEWDGNVGARILFKLIGATLLSRKK